jgi:putative transposase
LQNLRVAFYRAESMKSSVRKHHRRSIRLKGYDYKQVGAYFVTVVARNRACLFADIVNGETRLNGAGRVMQSAWDDLPNHYPGVACDAFVVMPNHIHGIIVVMDTIVGAGLKPAPTRHGLPEIIRGFKTFSARRINDLRSTPGTPIWQRNYYEHIIRNEEELTRIREYVANNPLQWEDDRENPLRSDTVGAGLKPAPMTEPWKV